MKKWLNPFMKTQPRFFGYYIDAQQSVRFGPCCFFIHLFEMLSGYTIGKSTLNLFRLISITGLENQVLFHIETGRALNTHPTVNQETNGERDVSVFDTEMIADATSSCGFPDNHHSLTCVFSVLLFCTRSLLKA